MQSPDGDVIDCVLSHLQPAFDHPELKGQKPLVTYQSKINTFYFEELHPLTSSITYEEQNVLQDLPERPKSHNSTDTVEETYQLWSESGEACPEGTVPIRRTTEKDILRASSVQRFGRKLPRRHVRRDSSGSGHEVSDGSSLKSVLDHVVHLVKSKGLIFCYFFVGFYSMQLFL